MIPDANANTVKRDFVIRDQNNNEVDLESRVRGYKYGSEVIPLSVADEQSIILRSEPVVRLLEFLPSSRIPRHHYLENTVVIEADSTMPQFESCQQMFKEFNKSLQATDQVCMARFRKERKLGTRSHSVVALFVQ